MRYTPSILLTCACVPPPAWAGRGTLSPRMGQYRLPGMGRVTGRTDGLGGHCGSEGTAECGLGSGGAGIFAVSFSHHAVCVLKYYYAGGKKLGTPVPALC